MADNGAGTSLAIHRRHRLTRDVAMDPLQRVGRGEWEHAREHLVQGDAQRVEIAPGIDRAIHAPGLLGGHVGEGAGDDLRRGWRQAFSGKSRGDAKAGQPHAVRVIDQSSRGLDVSVNEPLPMSLAKGGRQADGDAQDPGQIDRLLSIPLHHPIQRFTAWISKNEDRSPSMTSPAPGAEPPMLD